MRFNVSLSKPFRIALLGSAPTVAIDEAKMLEEIELPAGRMRRIAAYLSTYDEEHIVIREGMQPPWFRLRQIRARELNSLVSDPNDPTGAELWTIAQRCLDGVDGLDGFTLGESDFVTDPMRGVRALKDDALDRLADVVGIEGVRDLGRSVLKRAQPASRLAPFALPRG